MNDLKFAFRQLLKNPGFTAVAVLTLALGIGANTAIFSVLNGVLLSPLPYNQPDRLVMLFESLPDAPQIMVSYPDYLDWRARTRSFDDIAIFNGFDSFNATTRRGDPERIHGGLASGNLFAVLGVGPAAGRLFGPADDQPGAPAVVVITDKLWQRRFAGDPKAIGTQLALDGTSYTIIGVLPPTFTLYSAQLWLPLGRFTTSPRFARDNHPGLIGIGRLKTGVTLAQMRADLSAVAKQLQSEHPDNDNIGAIGSFITDIVVGDIKPALLMLAGAVALVLLVACANVANLLLGRAAARQKEFGLRVAIGASRGRLVRQLLTESVVLALFGGVVGVALAWAGVKLLVALKPENVPRLGAIHVSGTVLGFALAISVVTGVLFGLVPAVHATHSDPISALREGTRGSGGGRSRIRMRAGLTVVEVGLALMLLVGAGLMLRSFVNLLAVDPGFDKRGTVVARIQLPDRQYRDEPRRRAAFEELIGKVRALPGIADAALATDLPISSSWQTGITYEGAVAGSPDAERLTPAATIFPGYFHTLRIAMLAGRDFAMSDRPDQPPVVVISRAVAMRFFGTVNAVGRRIRHARAENEPWATVVGVVNDVKNFGLQGTSPGQLYYPSGQADMSSAWLFVRTDTPLETIGPMLRRTIASVDRELPLALLQTLESSVDSSISQPKFSMVMLTIFAGIALALAAVGIYGVISYSVAQRTREIGVRLALGAQRADVVRMVVGQGMALSVVGVVAGGLAAAASGQVMAKHLFGVKSSDPTVFVGVAATLLVVAFIASAVPALRATRIDPVDAMRGE